MSTVNTGYKQVLLFGNETAYGSAAVINQTIGIVQSVNPTETNNYMKVRTLGGSRDYQNVIPGKYEASGSFEFQLQGAQFLRMAFGEDTGTTGGTDLGPKIHTGASYLHIMGSAASPLANSFPSFTLEFTDDEDGGNPGTYNLKRRYTGCRVNSANITGNVDTPVSVSVDYNAQNVIKSTAAATSVTAVTTDPYVFYQGAVYATSGAVSRYTTQASLASARICEVNSFTFGINNNLESVWYICGTSSVYQNVRGAKQIIPKGRDYEGSLALHFNTKLQYERFLGAVSATGPQTTPAKYAVVLDFVRSGTIGGTPKVATDNWIRVVMNNTAFGSINITGAPEDIVQQNITLDVGSVKCYAVDADANYKL